MQTRLGMRAPLELAVLFPLLKQNITITLNSWSLQLGRNGDYVSNVFDNVKLKAQQNNHCNNRALRPDVENIHLTLNIIKL